jgi:YdjC-like protein
MIVCADDYGLREDINNAILALVAQGRLSAVSCLVALERCTPAVLAELVGHGPRVDLGLHLCLTDEALPLSPTEIRPDADGSSPRFSILLRRSLLGRLNRRQMAAEVSAQYELFLEKCDRKPDFIDGHLHVHQLPGIRDGLLDFLGSLPLPDRPYVRNTGSAIHRLWRGRLPWLKTAFIGAFGASMCHHLRAAGVPTNRGFAGIYDFRRSNRYADYLPRFVSCLDHANGLLVVHPGHEEPWRQHEFQALRVFGFPAGSPNRFQRGFGV